MRKVALSALLHEPGKLAAAVVGIAFAAALVLVQTGVYYGFQQLATNVIERVGGDVWVMAKGTELLDFADPISESARKTASSHACVVRTRGLLMAWSSVRKLSGATENVEVVGFEPPEAQQSRMMPWSFQTGVPTDLQAPLRVAVDGLYLQDLELPPNAVGKPIVINDRTVYVGAVTKGIRSITIVPYVFTELRNAQRIMGLGDTYSYIVLDLKDASCVAEVKGFIGRGSDLSAYTREDFGEMTAHYWIDRSGVGTTIQFMAVLSFVVGLVIVAQVLYALTESRLRELATLKAMGAGGLALLSYVAWQAGVLALVGGAVGVVLAMLIRAGVETAGITVVLSPHVLLIGLGAIVLMCAAASYTSGRKIMTLRAAEVFR